MKILFSSPRKKNFKWNVSSTSILLNHHFDNYIALLNSLNKERCFHINTHKYSEIFIINDSTLMLVTACMLSFSQVAKDPIELIFSISLACLCNRLKIKFISVDKTWIMNRL